VLRHFAIVRNVGAPLGRIVAEKIVALARQQVCAHHAGFGVPAHKLHTEHGRRLRLPTFDSGRRKLGGARRQLRAPGFESEHSLARRQIEQVTAAAGKKLHPAVGLSLVGFKAEGKLAIRRDGACLLGLRRPLVRELGRRLRRAITSAVDRGAELP